MRQILKTLRITMKSLFVVLCMFICTSYGYELGAWTNGVPDFIENIEIDATNGLNVVWNLDELGKDSLGFIFGHNPCRLVCFLTNFSHAYKRLSAVSDFLPADLPSSGLSCPQFQTLPVIGWVGSKQLDRSFFMGGFSHAGQVYYLPSQDLLYCVIEGQDLFQKSMVYGNGEVVLRGGETPGMRYKLLAMPSETNPNRRQAGFCEIGGRWVMTRANFDRERWISPRSEFYEKQVYYSEEGLLLAEVDSYFSGSRYTNETQNGDFAIDIPLSVSNERIDVKYTYTNGVYCLDYQGNDAEIRKMADSFVAGTKNTNIFFQTTDSILGHWGLKRLVNPELSQEIRNINLNRKKHASLLLILLPYLLALFVSVSVLWFVRNRSTIQKKKKNVMEENKG